MEMKLQNILSWLLLGVILMCGNVAGEVHYHDFIVKEKNYTRLCETKRMLVVNGQFPGQTLYVRKGDIMFVNVQNQGAYGLTLHWHGVKQPRNPWSDGPEYVTQCPIPPGQNFTYEVVFSREEGTLWWHAHSNWTRNTVHGAIVIHPAENTTYPFPKPSAEQVLILGSWFKYDVNLVVETDMETGIDLPFSSSFLINGQPGDFMNCSKESTFRMSVDYGKTYLLRILNSVMSSELFFAIAGHNLTVVGMDGEYLKPFSTRYMMIAPGQTMDVLLTANQSVTSRYYMAAREFHKDLIHDHTNTTAILEYNDSDNSSTPIFPESLPQFTDYFAGYSYINQLRSLATKEYPVDVPTNITTHMFITLSMGLFDIQTSTGDAGITVAASMNNLSWVNPATDVLQAYYRNLSGFFAKDFPDDPPAYYNFTAEDYGLIKQPMKATKVKMFNYNEQVEIVFQSSNINNGSDDHPMHLHGHSLYVVGFGGGTFNPQIHPLTYNLIDPPLVNTITVPKDGWTTVRFTANNPGVWLLHCHISHHLSFGMNTVFIVRNGDTPESTMRGPPLQDMPSCKSSSMLLPHESSEPRASI